MRPILVLLHTKRCAKPNHYKSINTEITEYAEKN